MKTIKHHITTSITACGLLALPVADTVKLQTLAMGKNKVSTVPRSGLWLAVFLARRGGLRPSRHPSCDEREGDAQYPHDRGVKSAQPIGVQEQREEDEI